MAISFQQIPSNIRVPGSYIEISNQRAQGGLAQFNNRILVIGQMLNTGTATAATPVLVTTKEQAITLFGRGSMLANMFDTLFANNPYTEKWCVPLSDNGAGAAAAGTITVTGPATAAGTINLYVAGVLVQTAVASADVQNTVATNIAAAINANLDLPVTATAATNVVTVTARHKGVVSNDIDLRLNYRGELGSEKTPAGLSIVIVQLTGGTANPDIATAITALPDEIFDYWLVPYTDATNLGKLETELTSRFSAMRMLEGEAFLAYKGTVSALGTLGNAHNNKQVSIMDASNNSPTPSYLWASAYAGQVAYAASIDPARPFNTLPLIGVLAEPEADRRNITENNTLLYDGISTHFVARDGTVQIQRSITTYQLNTAGVIDNSYLDTNRPLTLSYLRQTLKARITQKFPRHKLAKDGTRFGTGQAVVTPKIVRNEIIALAGEWEEAGLVEDMEMFKQLLVVEINASDSTRLDSFIPPDLIDGFQIFAAQLAFL